MPIEYMRKNGRSLGRISVVVKPPQQVIVTAHPLMPEFAVRQFVNSKADWINAQIAKLLEWSAKHASPPGTLPIFGQPYRVVWTNDETKPLGIATTNKTLTWNVWNRTHQTSAKFETALRNFLQAKAKQYLSLRTEFWAHEMKLKPKRLTYKEQTSRWGSCSTNQSVSFNWRLVHVPPAVSDYVVIHELAHLKEMNHSTAFWQIVAQFDPGYRIHRGWLKRHGHDWENAWLGLIKHT